MNLRPFITCAITGAGDTAGVHPDLPVSPTEIAESAIEAARAGAAVVHCHVRDHKTGAGSRKLEYYAQVVELIRASDADVLINLTAGMGGDLQVGPKGGTDTPATGSDLLGPLERIEHVEALRPDICTMDCGSLNFDDDSLVYVMPPSYLRRIAERLQEIGVKPELEVFDLGQIVFAGRMIAEGLIDTPALLQFCLGIPQGAPATPQAMSAMLDHLPSGSIWSGFGIGRMEMPMVAQAMLLGGNLRVGLEDNLYLERGVFASNADLVRRAREIVERLGGRLAGPDEVREQLWPR